MTLTPPLQLAWRKDTQFVTAVAGNDSLYGITPSGKIQALRASDGALRWESQGTYLTNRLVLQGNRLFAFRQGDGLTYIDDGGNSAVERLALSFSASASASIDTPVVDEKWIYLAVNEGILAIHQDQGLQFGMTLSDVVPHTVCLVGNSDIVVIDGAGTPARYRATDSAFELIWAADQLGIESGRSGRPFVIAGQQLIVGVGAETVAYDLRTGKVVWRLDNLPANSYIHANGIVYSAFHGSSISAIRAFDGSLFWQRQYMYDISLHREYRLMKTGDFLYVGGTLKGTPDASYLLSVQAEDGVFKWLSRAVKNNWVGGIPLTDGNKVFCYGGADSGCYMWVNDVLRVPAESIIVTPRPLRGPAAAFGPGKVTLTLPISVRVSIGAYREGKGIGAAIATNVNWSAGSHEVQWDPKSEDGYSDRSQFGYMQVDVTETGGPSYTHSVLLPVNTFPDVIHHWAQNSIEIMTYHKYVSGYPDQLFRPNGLVTRAESSTIIAKTLGLEGPTTAFPGTKFVDIAGHWAQDYIMALEEKGIINGFQEADGSYTFRPSLNMTRAQEARILAKAYNIPPAPNGFATKFVDVKGHWGEADIMALEAGGYVNGFRESDGSLTYRPDHNLTRAELSTVVTRIRKLTR